MNLFLADLSDMSEDQIKEHIAANYAGSVSGFACGSPSAEEQDALRASLIDFNILVAYESVGDYGCDSSSWFLIRNRTTGTLFESHGGHCSCYGFEGQWAPEEVTVDHILSDKFYMPVGGYDDAGYDGRQAEVVNWVRQNLKPDPVQTSLL